MFTDAISRAVLSSIGITLGALIFLAPVEFSGQSESRATQSRIQANSNRESAGKRENGILTLHLELRQGDWYPEADTGPNLRGLRLRRGRQSTSSTRSAHSRSGGHRDSRDPSQSSPGYGGSARLASAPRRCKSGCGSPCPSNARAAIRGRCGRDVSILRQRRWGLGRLRSSDSRGQPARRCVCGRSAGASGSR